MTAPLGVATVVAGARDTTKVMGYGSAGFAIQSDGTLIWWGSLLGGPAGPLVSQGEPAPYPGAPRVVRVAPGSSSCVVDIEGGVWCWGRNMWKELGDEGPWRLEPKRVEGLGGAATDVFVGGSRACARLDDASLWCWGRNQGGLLGLGDQVPVESSAVPGRLDLPPVKTAAVGGFVACAVSEMSELYCWGVDTFGGMGWEGGVTASDVPVLVPAVRDVEQVVATESTVCVLTREHVVLCSGVLAELGRDFDPNGPPDTTFKPVEFEKTKIYDGPPG